jgi:hypothetical protein
VDSRRPGLSQTVVGTDPSAYSEPALNPFDRAWSPPGVLHRLVTQTRSTDYSSALAPVAQAACAPYNFDAVIPMETHSFKADRGTENER